MKLKLYSTYQPETPTYRRANPTWQPEPPSQLESDLLTIFGWTSLILCIGLFVATGGAWYCVFRLFPLGL